jgi:hypothetical protein
MKLKILTASLFLGAFITTKADATIPTYSQKGSINIGGFNFKLGGQVKLDGYYDVNARGGTFGLDPTTLPLIGLNPLAQNKGHFNFSLLGSRLYLGAEKDFGNLPTSAYVEFDFAKDQDVTTNSLSPRIRHLYTTIDVKTGIFLIGQTWLTYQDTDAFANTLDNLYGGSRQPMIRYTHRVTPQVNWAFALEKPQNQYIDSFNNLFDNNTFGKSQMPDLTTQLRWNHCYGHLSLSGVARRLQAFLRMGDNGSLVNVDKKAFGWGTGFSGRFNFYKKSGFYWQINGGKGPGHYFDDATQDFYLEYPTVGSPLLQTRLQTLTTSNFIAGVEIWLADKLAATLAGSITHYKKPTNTPALTNFNRTQQRYHANLIYQTSKGYDLGIEVMHYRRKAGTATQFKGKDTRILASFIYRFGAPAS